MKLKKLTRKQMLEKAGIDPLKAPMAGGGVDLWTPVVLPSSATGGFEKSHLAKSIVANVNDPRKKASYLQMVDSLFRGITLGDFSQYFDESTVVYKVAHSFKYKGMTLSLHELKKGKKDRIYIYAYSCVDGKYVFVLEALHKDQQQTPQEIKDYAEKTIKNIVEARLSVS